MTSISDGESGSSVRAKLNASLLQTDAFQLGSRAALVTLGAYTNGALYSDGTHWYRGSTGATAITDLPGLVPLPPYHLDQWGVTRETNTGQASSSEDNSTAIQEAIDWMQDNGGLRLYTGSGVIAHASTIYFGDGTHPVLLIGDGRGDPGSGKTSSRLSAATRFLLTGTAGTAGFVLTSNRDDDGTKERNQGGGAVDICFDGGDIGDKDSAQGGWGFTVNSHSDHDLKIRCIYWPGGHFKSTCLVNNVSTGAGDNQRFRWDIHSDGRNATNEPYAHVLIDGYSPGGIPNNSGRNTSIGIINDLIVRCDSEAEGVHFGFCDGLQIHHFDCSVVGTAVGTGGYSYLHADDTLVTYHSGYFTGDSNGHGHARELSFAFVQHERTFTALQSNDTQGSPKDSGPNWIAFNSRGNGSGQPTVEGTAELEWKDADAGLRIRTGLRIDNQDNLANHLNRASFTPAIADAASSGNEASATITANYGRIGDKVFVNIRAIDIDTTGLTGGNDLYITGLPVAASNANFASFNVSAANVSFTGTLSGEIDGGTTTALRIAETASGAARDFVTVSELTSGSADLYINGWYMV